LASYRRRFLDGAFRRGVEPDVAEGIFASIEAFSGFGFPKSHSVAFALLAYQSAWLKVHYGPEYLASLLNEQPMGFYSPDSLIQYGRRTGIEVLPPDVNESRVESGVEATRTGDLPAVRLGLGRIKRLSGANAERLVSEREAAGPYGSIPELASRAGLGRPALEALAWSGALRSLPDGERARALWTAGVSAAPSRSGRTVQPPLPFPETVAPELDEPEDLALVRAEYASTGVSLGEHPMQVIRAEGDPGTPLLVHLRAMPHGTRTEAIGIVRIMQRPATAKGTCFVLLEDETEVLNLIVPPRLARVSRLMLRTARILRAGGRIERQGDVVNLVCTSLHPFQSAGSANRDPMGGAPARRGFRGV